MNHVCLVCGKVFQYTRAKDYVDNNGCVISPAGSQMRSYSIVGLDPVGKFCTLRCAAGFGVGQAERYRPIPHKEGT
jgi:hypothetical protein